MTYLNSLPTRGLVLHAEPRRWEGQSHSLGGRRRFNERAERHQPIRGLPRTTKRNLRINHKSKRHSIIAFAEKHSFNRKILGTSKGCL